MKYINVIKKEANLDLLKNSNIKIDTIVENEYRGNNAPCIVIEDEDNVMVNVYRDLSDFKPIEKTIYSKFTFMNSFFTTEQRRELRNSSDTIIIDFLYMLDLADYVDTENKVVIDSLKYLREIGIL